MTGTAFEITQGAERPTLPYYFTQAGTAVDLSGAGVVTFKMRDHTGTAWVLNQAASVLDVATGAVAVNLPGTVPVGEYRGHFEVAFPGASDLIGWEVPVRVVGAAPYRGGPGIRDGMGRLVAQVRRLVDDGPGPTQEFDDWEVQEALDRHRRDVYDLEAYPTPQRRPGTVEWHDYPLNVSDWESGTAFVVTTVGGQVLTPNEIDYQRGILHFNANTLGSAMFVTGRYFDLYYAGASLLEGLISRASRAYDVSMDGQSFSRSQRADMLRKRAGELRSMSPWASNARLTRPDMPGATYWRHGLDS